MGHARDVIRGDGDRVGALREHLSSAAGHAGEYFDSATSSVGRGVEGAAGAVARGSSAATDGMSAAGRYLQDSNARRMGRDLTDLVRHNPTASLCVGLGIGYLVGRLITNRRS